MRTELAAIFMSLLSSLSVAGTYAWEGTNMPVGVVLERVRRTNGGIEVRFWSDQEPPYLVGVYDMSIAAYGDFSTPRFPIREVETDGWAAFVPGAYVDRPVMVCVLVKGITDLSWGRTNQTEASSAALRESRKRFLGVRNYADGGRWSGTYARPDGTFGIVDAKGREVAQSSWTCPAASNRSVSVLVPVPFASLSSHDNLRYNMTTDGYRYFQVDSNSVPHKIGKGGAR